MYRAFRKTHTVKHKEDKNGSGVQKRSLKKTKTEGPFSARPILDGPPLHYFTAITSVAIFAPLRNYGKSFLGVGKIEKYCTEYLDLL
jgi:hypothetical protein